MIDFCYNGLVDEIDIFLDSKLLEESIERLNDNEDFLVLSDNLFSIDMIKTCFGVEEINGKKFEENDFCYFTFSYNDEIVKKLFNINVVFEETNMYGFLKTSTYMDENQLNSLVEKVYDIAKNDENVSKESLENNLYNEALIFVTSGINNNECKDFKDDFESKFKIYQEKHTKINEKLKKLIKTLHSKIIEIKVR